VTELLSAGEAIVARAVANGAETIFGIPGAQIYPLFDGMDRFGVKLMVPRHEQAAAYMAMGYAKSTGRIGVCAVVPGPGVLNASAALCTAMGNGSAVVCLTGEVPSQYRGRGRGHLHELRDQAGTLRTILKNAFHISDFKEVNLSVDRAFQLAASHRPGPVAVQMCWDTMAETADYEPGNDTPLPVLKPALDHADVVRTAELIAAARKPMIMCGAGAQHASASVVALAEMLDAPVTAFRSGRGVVAEDHALAAPPVAARELWDDVDLLIGIGSRLEMPYMRWRSGMRYESKPSGPQLIRIDIDRDEMTRLIPDVGVVGDADEAVRALVGVLESRLDRPGGPARRAEIAAANALARSLIARIVPQAAYLDTIRAVVPRDGFIVPELSQLGFATYTGALPIYEPRTYVTEGHQGTLGFGFPTALGVKVANPHRAVVSLTGDGGFMFGVQELATAAEHGIGVVTLLFNNGSYANVLRDQRQGSGRVIGSTFRNPNFMKLASAFDVAATRVDSPETLAPALEWALAEGKPHLIEVMIEPGSETSPWPLIHMSKRPSLLAFP
jgi:acetolactate synthase-1/2/3 large subunit